MGVSFIPFLKVTATHDYYESGIAESLSFMPDQASSGIIKNHRLKFKSILGGFELSYQSANGSDPIIETEGIKLRFLIRLEEALAFYNFTDLSDLTGYTPKKKLYFRNNPQGTAAIDATLIDFIRPSQFSYALPDTTSDPDNETATLKMFHESGGAPIVIEDIIARRDGSYETPIDLSKNRPGLYQFSSELSISEEEGMEKILIDNKAFQDEPFAILDIDYASDSLSAYELVFEKKSNLWNYFLINRSNRSDLEFAALLIKDNNLSNTDPYQSYLFSKVESGLEVSGYKAVKFQSTTTIPFYEKPKKFIQVVREVDGSDLVLMKHLANPPVNQISSDEDESDIYVFV